jgi:signal transduction histidine kinase
MTEEPRTDVAALHETDNVEDVSECKAAEDRIRALNDELGERVAELEVANAEFAKANKELEAFSQLLLNGDGGPLTDMQVDLMRRIRNSGLQAKHIIDDLRGLADVTRRELFAEEVDISAVAQQVVEDLRVLTPDRQVTFTVRPDLRAYGDPALVRLLLVNLLQNAWKYTGREERAVIEMTCERGRSAKSSTSKTTGSGSTTSTANASSRRSSDCTPTKSSGAPGSPPRDASFAVTAETFGRRGVLVAEPPSRSLSRRLLKKYSGPRWGCHGPRS